MKTKTKIPLQIIQGAREIRKAEPLEKEEPTAKGKRAMRILCAYAENGYDRFGEERLLWAIRRVGYTELKILVKQLTRIVLISEYVSVKQAAEKKLEENIVH